MALERKEKTNAISDIAYRYTSSLFHSPWYLNSGGFLVLQITK